MTYSHTAQCLLEFSVAVTTKMSCIRAAGMKMLFVHCLGFGSIGASKIRTRSKIYPNTTAPEWRNVASGVTSDTANPRGVKSQHGTIRDES